MGLGKYAAVLRLETYRCPGTEIGASCLDLASGISHMAALPKVQIGSNPRSRVMFRAPVGGLVHNMLDRGIEKASRIANKWTTMIAIKSLGRVSKSESWWAHGIAG